MVLTGSKQPRLTLHTNISLPTRSVSPPLQEQQPHVSWQPFSQMGGSPQPHWPGGMVASGELLFEASATPPSGAPQPVAMLKVDTGAPA
jgi:hypothetical protein